MAEVPSEPSGRVYDEQEKEAFRLISRQVWGQAYKPGAGPPTFATGHAWPTLLRGMADRAEREAYLYRVAARAMGREIAREAATQNGPSSPPEEER